MHHGQSVGAPGRNPLGNSYRPDTTFHLLVNFFHFISIFALFSYLERSSASLSLSRPPTHSLTHLNLSDHPAQFLRMKLTPIKVRGKSAQKKTWKPPENPAVQASKKPRRNEDGNDDPQPLHKRFRSRKPAAAVEELPTEILERIIIMSKNLNFLRSSLRVGYRFSSPSFMSELLGAAFEPTWEMWLGYSKDTVVSDVIQKRLVAFRSRPGPVNCPLLEPESVPGDPDFQVCEPRRLSPDLDAIIVNQREGWMV